MKYVVTSYLMESVYSSIEFDTKEEAVEEANVKKQSVYLMENTFLIFRVFLDKPRSGRGY